MTLDAPMSNTSNFKIFPNPVQNVLLVSFPENIQSTTLSIYDILGKRVNETLITVDSRAINLEHLPSGIYIAKLQTDSHKVNTFKLIKE